MEENYKAYFDNACIAARRINLLSVNKINDVLNCVADAVVIAMDNILTANKLDLDKKDINDPFYDRLKLTPDRIQGIVADIRNVATLESPLGKVLSETIRPNEMSIKKITVPFGVIGVIYEARPNVTLDVFSLCLKSGNACILKGSTDAHNSNLAIIKVIKEVLMRENVDPNAATLLPASHDATAEMLNAVGKVDLIIPRGSSRLINYVRDNSRVPVIETGAGICHTYFHSSGDVEKGGAIIKNAKTRRVSVCNSLDCLVIDISRVPDLLQLVAPMIEKNVTIYADEVAFAALDGKYPYLERATAESWGCEYLDYKISIKTVTCFDEAIDHITQYSSKHSESIVAEDKEACNAFALQVDAACVYTNVSTAFTDGSQFGLGAEIGISTQKLHARGPMALHELTSYKYLIEGNGQIRQN